MKLNKMAFVLTPYVDRAFDTISMPLGLAWLNSYIKQHISNIEFVNYDLLLEPDIEHTLYNNIGEYDAIGIQAHSNATYHEAVRIAKKCKELRNEVVIICGGNAATFMTAQLLQTGYVDFVVLGEGEISLTNLLIKLRGNQNNYSCVNGIAYRDSNSKIIITKKQPLISDLNSIPLPDRDAFNWSKYPQWSLITSRGCPYSCSFCSSSKFWGKGIRYRSAENVYSELHELVNKYHVKHLYILDDTFGANSRETQKLLRIMISERLKVSWACLTRADIVSNELLLLFKEAGCVQVHFGLESANTKTQSETDKRLDIDRLREAVKYCSSIGLRTKLSVIFGLPKETSIDIKYTISVLEELLPNEIQIYPLMPYIGINTLQDTSIYELHKGEHNWKQDALKPLTESDCLPYHEQISLTQDAIETFRKLGYKWIPMDMNPEKRNELRIIKTVFAPIQGLDKD